MPDLPDLPSVPIVASTTPGISPTATSRMLTAHASSRPLPLIYGKQPIGGQYAWGASLGASGLVLLFYICEGPINAIPSITFDGFDYAGLGITASVHLGTSSQTVDPLLAGLNPNFTSGFPGTAYAVLTIPAPTSVTAPFNPLSPVFLVEGRKVRDPRLDPTLVTRYYSVNPALCTADFMTANRFGMGTPDAFMDWAGSITDAANDCDAASGRPAKPVSAPSGIQGSAPGNLSGGQYYYTQTFVDTGGIESLESPAALVTTGSGAASVVLTISTGGAGIAGRRVYRNKVQTGATAPRWRVADVTDNTTTTIADVTSDASMGPGSPGGDTRYTLNMAITQQADFNAILENLRANWMGVVTYNGGLYRMYVDKQKANSGITYSDDPADPVRNMIGPPTFHLKLSEEVPTRVEGTYVNAAKNWADDVAVAELPGVTTGDLPRVIKRIEIRGTDSYDQGQRLVTTVLNRGQDDKQVTIRTLFDGIQSQIMDRVTIHSALAGLSADYLITDIQQDGSSWVQKGEIYDDGTYSNTIQTNNPPGNSPYLDPYSAPENVPQASIGDTNSPTMGFLFFQGARVYSLELWGASYWSQSNLASFNAARVNDGFTNAKAFDAAAATDAWLQYDGVSQIRAFGKVQISFVTAPASNQMWLVEYSDNGSAWTTTTTAMIAGALMTTTYTLEWKDAGAHRYWRIRKGSTSAETSANYSDVQFFDAQPDPFVDHYEIWDNSGATPRYYSRVEKTPLPTSTNPVNITSLVSRDVHDNQNYNILVKTVRINLKPSSGANHAEALSPGNGGLFIINDSALQSPGNFNIDGYGQLGMLWVHRTDITVANGLNSNIALPGTGYVALNGPTGAFSIGGIVPPSSPDGPILLLICNVIQAMTIVNNDASSSVGNKINTLSGSNLVMPAGKSAVWLIYDTVGSAWNVIASYPASGGGGGSGTVTSIATTAPITGGTITTTGTIGISITTTNDGGALVKQGSSPGTQQSGHGNISGSFIAGTSLGAGLTTTPRTAVDVNGLLSIRAAAVSLSNGLNSNISLPSSGIVRITGPSGAFSIGGIVPPSSADGAILDLINTTSQQMTIVNASGSSSAANRINTLSGVDVVLQTGASSARLVYDATSTTWFLVSVFPGTAAVGGGGGGNQSYSTALGSEPTGAAGDLDFYTNGYAIGRYGAAWGNNWGPIFPLTKPPAVASFTWLNQGATATATDLTNQGIYLNGGTSSASHNPRILATSMSGGLTKLEIGFLPNWGVGAGAAELGLVVRETATGKFYRFFTLVNNGACPFYIGHNSAFTTVVANDITSVLFATSPVFMQYELSGSSMFFRIGTDLQHWSALNVTINKTSYFTTGPDQWGVFVDPESTTIPCGMTLIHYKTS